MRRRDQLRRLGFPLSSKETSCSTPHSQCDNPGPIDDSNQTIETINQGEIVKLHLDRSSVNANTTVSSLKADRDRSIVQGENMNSRTHPFQPPMKEVIRRKRQLRFPIVLGLNSLPLTSFYSNAQNIVTGCQGHSLCLTPFTLTRVKKKNRIEETALFA